MTHDGNGTKILERHAENWESENALEIKTQAGSVPESGISEDFYSVLAAHLCLRGYLP